MAGVKANGIGAEMTGPSAVRFSPNTVSVVLGVQFGDEGKGNIVDLLCQKADIVCRCQKMSRLQRKESALRSRYAKTCFFKKSSAMDFRFKIVLFGAFVLAVVIGITVGVYYGVYYKYQTPSAYLQPLNCTHLIYRAPNDKTKGFANKHETIYKNGTLKTKWETTVHLGEDGMLYLNSWSMPTGRYKCSNFPAPVKQITKHQNGEVDVKDEGQTS